MKKRIVKLTESDLEKLVQRIIKEENINEEDNASSFDIKDVDNWMEKFQQYFINKQVGQAATRKINTVPEQAAIIAALMDFFKVTPAQISKAKQLLLQKRKEQGQQGQKQDQQQSGEEDLNFDA